MGFNCGIVGLPNVGKSTLFNALTATQAAQAANFPFCTIEPNVGRVAVPDVRLDKIAAITGSEKIIPTQIEFVDIAGLVRGASKGEGLGNQFLANIRETDAIFYVLRCFENSDITHVEGSIDPLRDADTIETELMLADMESLEKRLGGLEKKAKGGDAEAKIQLPLIAEIRTALDAGRPARSVKLTDEQKIPFQRLQLLTGKPALYICNVSEADAASGNDWTAQVAARAAAEGTQSVIISAAIESELAQMPAEDGAAFLADLGLTEPGLNKIIRAGHALLGLMTFFTTGPKETRAWEVHKGAKAPQAAGVIHTDFERGFIKAETIAYADFIALGGESKAREAGKLRQEGKEYVVQDGDIMHFKFNV
jgi:GTP-binding protein YchF